MSLVETLVAIGVFGILVVVSLEFIGANRKVANHLAEDARIEAFEGQLRGQLYTSASTRLNWMNANGATYPECAPAMTSNGSSVSSTTNGAVIGVGGVFVPATGPRFGFVSVENPVTAVSALHIINVLNGKKTPSFPPDSAESYLFPIWKLCMKASVVAIIDLLNTGGGGGGAGTFREFVVNQHQCLPFGGNSGYIPIPKNSDEVNRGSFLKRSTMGYYKAEAWDFSNQTAIPCGPGPRWVASSTRGFRIRYSLGWERDGVFRAKTGVLDVYEP